MSILTETGRPAGLKSPMKFQGSHYVCQYKIIFRRKVHNAEIAFKTFAKIERFFVKKKKLKEKCA